MSAPAAPSIPEALLREALTRAHEAWPGIEVPEGEYASHLAGRLEPGLAALEWADLYLACACARGDRQALKVFEDQVLAAAIPALSRLCGSAALVEEAQQLLRQKLLVGGAGGERARILDYSGRGPLAHYVTAAATRVALNLKRGASADSDDEALAQLPARGDDAELAYIKESYRREFVEAFQGALGTLSERDRTLLRLNFLDGLNIEEIGGMYRVHRATVARWIAKAREQLHDETRRRLQEKLRLTPSELRSLMNVADSHLEVSLSRFLA
ncbi:MAG: sigma factor-like helix-turn-helix DNA-binding protein [Myxococcales bacterium]